MDLFQRLQPVRILIETHLEPLVTAHLLALGVLTVLSAGILLEPFRRTSRRHLVALALIVVAAAGVRAGVIPALSSHVFDGHEADYFDVWRHASPEPDFAYRASGVLRQLYRWIGPVFGGSGWWLVVLHILASLLISVLVWSWLCDLTENEEAGLWAGALLAADPVLGFWSSSAYNILLPFVCSVAALAVLERAIRRVSPVAMAGAMGWWAAAVALRPEAVLLAVPLAWRLSAVRRIVLSHTGWWASLALPSILVAAYLVLGQQTHLGGGSAYLLSMFRRQVLMLDFLSPYARPSGLVAIGVAVVAIWTVWPRRRGLVLFFLGTAASQHLAFALFDDYGYRHTLVVRLCLASLAGAGLVAAHAFADERANRTRWPVWARAGAAPSTVLCLFLAILLPALRDTSDVAQRYYASAETFFLADHRFRETDDLDMHAYSACVWIAESGCIDTAIRASHFELFDDSRRKELEARSGGCVLFAYDRENYQASSRSIHARAVKVARFFELELIGRIVEPDRDCYALVFKVQRPRRGRW